MLSVIIPTKNSERLLVATLSPLVSGATAGLIGEVILADGGSRDDTAGVADIAGCRFMESGEPLAERLRIAAAAAKAPWLMFLRPGTVLESSWTAEAGHFIRRAGSADEAAVFRRSPRQAAWREAAALLAETLGARARPEQGLLIAKRFYDALGGHKDGADPETALLRRIGRARTVTLTVRALPIILD